MYCSERRVCYRSPVQACCSAWRPRPAPARTALQLQVRLARCRAVMDQGTKYAFWMAFMHRHEDGLKMQVCRALQQAPLAGWHTLHQRSHCHGTEAHLRLWCIVACICQLIASADMRGSKQPATAHLRAQASHNVRLSQLHRATPVARCIKRAGSIIKHATARSSTQYCNCCRPADLHVCIASLQHCRSCSRHLMRRRASFRQRPAPRLEGCVAISRGAAVPACCNAYGCPVLPAPEPRRHAWP